METAIHHNSSDLCTIVHPDPHHHNPNSGDLLSDGTAHPGFTTPLIFCYPSAPTPTVSVGSKLEPP
jgi:hypothetical protein